VTQDIISTRCKAQTQLAKQVSMRLKILKITYRNVQFTLKPTDSKINPFPDYF